MSTKSNIFALIYLSIAAVVLYASIAGADTIVDNKSITISAQVNNGITPGGGGGGGSISSPTEVKFSGTAYPSSKVYIVKDGTVAATTVADPGAKFAVTVGNIESGSYIFSVYGEDAKGRKSTSYSFPVLVTSGTSVTFGGMFLSPTIDTDKIEVKQGDPITIFGQSAPNAEVSIVVHSEGEHIKRIPTDSSGGYLLRFDSAPLEIGNHITKSAGILPADVSLFSNSAAFRVGYTNIAKDENACSRLRGDLNCDGKVNLVDFSIMAF